MKPQETIYIAVADTSMIIRSGLVSVLRRLPDLPVQVIEVSSEEGLKHCMEAHTPQILIINPQFGGWFDVAAFKQEYPESCHEIRIADLHDGGCQPGSKATMTRSIYLTTWILCRIKFRC